MTWHLRPSLESDPALDDPICGICHELFDNDQHIAVRITDVPGCAGHIFGATCLTEWMTSDSFATCPLCRTPLFADDDLGEQVPEFAQIANAFRTNDGEHDLWIDSMRRITLAIEGELRSFESIATNVIDDPTSTRTARAGQIIEDHGVDPSVLFEVFWELHQRFGQLSSAQGLARLQEWAMGRLVIPMLGPQRHHADQAAAIRSYIFGVTVIPMEYDPVSPRPFASISAAQRAALRLDLQRPDLNRVHYAFSQAFTTNYAGWPLADRNIARVLIANESLRRISKNVQDRILQRATEMVADDLQGLFAAEERTGNDAAPEDNTEPSIKDAVRGVGDALLVLSARVRAKFFSWWHIN
ncbi:uncharacterized protein N0V89_000267 [Didymosphaeria variabile]|uniref:RING-type domain-containing protein n=1 Tax=Didymosphaeria variabile TaxID=1932322 RepID=A0A9W8XV05_9PLEO|nr:uncharacterized protein N0V89_000267 [Didymosphaeria variabile]KAJ4359711.1 hypothetical protein N0V89_000267 [Didymosphaeria variabile]